LLRHRRRRAKGAAFGNVGLGAAFGLVIGAATGSVIVSQRNHHDGGS
jgi:hypothetical protein